MVPFDVPGLAGMRVLTARAQNGPFREYKSADDRNLMGMSLAEPSQRQSTGGGWGAYLLLPGLPISLIGPWSEPRSQCTCGRP